MTIHDVEQKSEAWLLLRAGRINASETRDMYAKGRTPGQEGVKRRDLRIQKVIERLTGRPVESSFQNDDMRRGVELEPAAVAAYEGHAGRLVQPVGYCTHDELMAGYSPDGFVGEDGLVECKAPRSANHLEYIRGKVVPADYVPQLTHGLWITGRQWIDFVSYDEKFSGPLEALQLFVVRLVRDEKAIAAHELAVRLFLREIEDEMAAITDLLKARAA